MAKRGQGKKARKRQKPKHRERPLGRMIQSQQMDAEPIAHREDGVASDPGHGSWPEAPVTRQSVLSSVPRPRPSDRAITTDVEYVLADLRRIGILAATAFGILAILTLIIR